MTTWTAHSRRAGRGAHPCRRLPKVPRPWLSGRRRAHGGPAVLPPVRGRTRADGGDPGAPEATWHGQARRPICSGCGRRACGGRNGGTAPSASKRRTACAPGLLLPVRRRACAASAGAGRRAGRAGAIACGGRRMDAGVAARGRALQIGPRRATGGRRPAPAIRAGSGRSDFPAPLPIHSPGQRGGRGRPGHGRRPGKGRRSLGAPNAPPPSCAASCRPCCARSPRAPAARPRGAPPALPLPAGQPAGSMRAEARRGPPTAPPPSSSYPAAPRRPFPPRTALSSARR